MSGKRTKNNNAEVAGQEKLRKAVKKVGRLQGKLKAMETRLAGMQEKVASAEAEKNAANERLREFRRDSVAAGDARARIGAQVRVESVTKVLSDTSSPPLATPTRVVDAEDMENFVQRFGQNAPNDARQLQQWISSVLASPSFPDFCKLVEQNL